MSDRQRLDSRSFYVAHRQHQIELEAARSEMVKAAQLRASIAERELARLQELVGRLLSSGRVVLQVSPLEDPTR